MASVTSPVHWQPSICGICPVLQSGISCIQYMMMGPLWLTFPISIWMLLYMRHVLDALIHPMTVQYMIGPVAHLPRLDVDVRDPPAGLLSQRKAEIRSVVENRSRLLRLCGARPAPEHNSPAQRRTGQQVKHSPGRNRGSGKSGKGAGTMCNPFLFSA